MYKGFGTGRTGCLLTFELLAGSLGCGESDLRVLHSPQTNFVRISLYVDSSGTVPGLEYSLFDELGRNAYTRGADAIRAELLRLSG